MLSSNLLMFKTHRTRVLVFSVVLAAMAWFPWREFHAQPTAGKTKDALALRYAKDVKPFLEAYCHSCHGAKKPKAMLDLAKDDSINAIVKNIDQWQHVLDRLHAKEMPPEDAKRQP